MHLLIVKGVELLLHQIKATDDQDILNQSEYFWDRESCHCNASTRFSVSILVFQLQELDFSLIFEFKCF